MPASACVVLVPVGGSIDPGCERALQDLESRGYAVRRVPGFSAIDYGRCVLATQALADGFDELMWIDADVAFPPEAVDRLRAHCLPLVCGLYAKKGCPEFACDFLPGAGTVTFGREGGLHEVRYAGFGFVLTRRAVFDAIRERFGLAECNRQYGKPLVPYFLPAVVDADGGPRYLQEDYAFCDRARRCGFPILADTTIRLWHVGRQGFTWEDVGPPRRRYDNYHVNLAWPAAPAAEPAAPPAGPAAPSPGPPDSPTDPAEAPMFTQDWTSPHVPLWEQLLGPLKERSVHALEVGVFEGRTTAWLLDHVLTHPDATLTYVDTFRGGADQIGARLEGLEERFHHNTRTHRAKLVGHKGPSAAMLRGLPFDAYDLVYVDGSHEAPDVLSDAVLSWPLLKAGGLLGFDDYAWRQFPEPERCPQLAIDAFLSVLRGRYELLHRGYQLWVRKLR